MIYATGICVYGLHKAFKIIAVVCIHNKYILHELKIEHYSAGKNFNTIYWFIIEVFRK